MDFDSDYKVEDYIKPTKVRVPLINDERADILGNFEDTKEKKGKRKVVDIGSEENPFADEDESENDDEENAESESDEEDEIIDDGMDEDDGNELETEDVEEEMAAEEETVESETVEDSVNETESKVNGSKSQSPKKPKKENQKQKIATPTNGESSTKLTDGQVAALMKGASKKDRFVLYVTNLNYETSRERLFEFFKTAGEVKSIRIPKSRRTAFAFVEMVDLQSYKNAFALHNQMLDEYKIKVQISEGGKKKSANKKNILKQKNRKLAEMRNEGKQFNRSGKGYNKTIKREIEQNKMQQQRRLAKKQMKKNKK